MLKLLFGRETCSLASCIALEEADADYQVIHVDVIKYEHRSPSYLKVNPKGRVPTLLTSAGAISETPAILTYIAQTFRGASLAPLSDPFEFAQVQAFNSYLCATVHVAHAHRMRGDRWAESAEAIAEMQRVVPRNMKECLRLIEETMFVGPWVRGEGYTICDPYLFTVARWMEGDGVDSKCFPRILDHRERMTKRPAVRKAFEQNTLPEH